MPINAQGDGCYTDSSGRVANVKEDDLSVYPDGVSAGYRRIEGPRDGDLSLEVPNPPQDVRDAWRAGWNGNGINVLIIDAFGGPGVPVSRSDDRGTHGYTVGMSAGEIAPGATFYALEAGLSSAGGGTDRSYRDTYLPVAERVPAGTSIDVINMSFGGTPGSVYPTATQLAQAFASGSAADFYADLTGGRGNGTDFLTNSGDAVLTKAAGNDGGADASRYLLNTALIRDSHTGPRTLIVGALNNYARPSTTNEASNVSTAATIASYSAVAGARTDMQERFLVEYGGTPYGERAFLCDNDLTPATCNNLQELDSQHPFQPLVGTSFAAPRVAGFAALVRGKFPGLSGAQTAKILLDTATYEGLACHPNCQASTYGQGRVDIADALSPIGKLE